MSSLPIRFYMEYCFLSKGILNGTLKFMEVEDTHASSKDLFDKFYALQPN